jgi:hypothetical protein
VQWNENLIFSWPRILVYQYNETNVMYFLFSLLRIKSLYMFQAAGAWCWPPTPFQRRGQERVELYLYSPSRPSRPVTGRTLPYIFQALLDHPQETLRKRHLVYCMRKMAVGCVMISLQSWHSQLPHLVSSYIFIPAHLILFHKNSLITSPQQSYCSPVMQPNVYADCQNIGIVTAKFPGSNDIRFYALCSLWTYVMKWNYSSLM